MTSLKAHTIRIGVAAALLGSTALSAHALDAGDAFARYTALVEKTGVGKLTYDAPTLSGDSATAENTKLTIEESGQTIVINFGTTTFSDVEDGDKGALNIGAMTMSGIDFSNEGFALTSGEISATDFQLPAVDATDAVVATYGSLNVDGMEAMIGGKPAFTIASMEGSIIGNYPDTALVQDFTINDVNMQVANLPDSNQAKGVLGALGYEEINMDVVIGGAWDPSGKLSLTDFDYIVDNIGTLSLDLDLDGYTEEVHSAITKIQAETTPENANQMSMKTLGELQKLSLVGGQIKFEDASITNKLLEFFAPQMGTDVEGLKAQANGMLPLVLSRLGDPELTQMVSAAVGKFLQDPNSLQIDIAPAEPVPFGEVMGAGMAAPQTLPKVLGAKVSANQ